MAVLPQSYWSLKAFLFSLIVSQLLICNANLTDNGLGCNSKNETLKCSGTPVAQARFGRKGFDPANTLVLVIAIGIIFAVVTLIYVSMCCGFQCCTNSTENDLEEIPHNTFDKSLVTLQPECVDMCTFNSINENTATPILTAGQDSAQVSESLASSSSRNLEELELVKTENGDLPRNKKQSPTIGDHVVSLLAVV